jgi:uncharacterized membrane protein
MDPVYTFAGSYDDVAEARADLDGIRELHAEKWIGGFQAAVFSKNADGKVKIVDTISTTRTSGATWGLALGAVLGLLFPAGVLLAAIEGAGLGALTGNVAKGWTHWDVKEIGAALESGETGLIVIARATPQVAAEQLLKNAKQTVKKRVDLDQETLEPVLAELGE